MGTATTTMTGRTARSERRRPGTSGRTSALERRAVWIIGVGAAVAAAAAGCSPTGTPVVDEVLTGGFALLVVHATAQARRWTWVTMAGIAAVASDTGLWVAVGAGALAVAVAGGLGPRQRWVGALAGALAVQPLLRLPDVGFTASSLLVVVAATAPVLVSALLVLPRRRRRRVRQAALAAAAFAVASGVLLVVAALVAASALDEGASRTTLGLEASSDADMIEAATLFAEAEAAFGRAEGWVGSVLTLPARAVPGLAQQARALDGLSTSARNLARAAGEAAVVADPQEFRYEGGRIDLDRLRAARGPLDAAVAALADTGAVTESLGSPWLLPPVRDRLERLDDAVDAATPSVELAAQAAWEVPPMLGGDGPRRYLVMFLQPAETRGLGGFMGAWVELTATDGSVRVSASGRPTDLNRAPGRDERTISGPPEYLARYGRFRPAYYAQDVPFSPDMPTVAQVMAELYPQAGGQPLDGVVAIDPAGLAALLRFTGPIRLPGTDIRLSADNAERFLLRDQYSSFGDDPERRDALELAGRETFERLVTGDLPAPRRLGAELGPLAEGRHLLAHGFDPGAQALLERLGVAGAASAPAGDGFMLVSQNKGNNKIDVFLHREVDYRVDFDPATGEVEATATITLHNDAPASGLPDAVIGSNDQGLPPGTNAMFFSFYTPHGLRGATLDGVPFGLETQRELGYRVYSRFIEIPPGGQRVIELDLAGRLEPGATYELEVVPQPVPDADRVTVRLSSPRDWIPVTADGFVADPGAGLLVSAFRLTGTTRVSAGYAPL